MLNLIKNLLEKVLHYTGSQMMVHSQLNTQRSNHSATIYKSCKVNDTRQFKILPIRNILV